MAVSVAGSSHPSSCQVLLEEDEPGRFRESKCLVGLMADGVPKFGVRGHLAAAPRLCPSSRRFDQRLPDPPPPHIEIDVPAFDVSDRARHTALSPGAYRCLHEPAQPAIRPI